MVLLPSVWLIILLVGLLIIALLWRLLLVRLLWLWWLLVLRLLIVSLLWRLLILVNGHLPALLLERRPCDEPDDKANYTGEEYDYEP